MSPTSTNTPIQVHSLFWQRLPVPSLETLLQLLLQKSLAATDAGAFALEIDDVVSQAEADAASVVELERMLGGIPELTEPPNLGELATPGPNRNRQGGFRRG